MHELSIYKIAKICIYIFFVYILWFIYLFGEKLSILYGSIFVATLCVSYEIIRNKKDIRSFCPYGILMNVIMCFYSVLTGVFVARNQQILIDNVKTYACFSIVCFDICYVSHREKNIEWLLKIIIAICVISSTNILINGTFVSGYGYVLSPKQNPNLLGLTMDLGIFSVAFKSIKAKKNNIIYYGLAVLFLYTIIQCGSRKCLLSALIICLFWMFTYIKKTWKKGTQSKIFVICLIVLFVLVIRYYYENIYINTYSYNRMEILGSDELGSSSQIRKMYYQYAVDYFGEHPFFGIGLGQFAVWNPLHGYSHSTYAEVLASWGFIGSVLYFSPAIMIGFKLFKTIMAKEHEEVTRIVLALWAMEIFMGVGQIWFYEIEHMMAWTLIYLFFDMCSSEQVITHERVHRYVKD